MHEEIMNRWNKMQEAKQRMSALIRTDDHNPKFSPVEGKWNTIQVMEHILSSEGGTLGYMKKKTSSGFESIESAEASHLDNGVALKNRLQSEEKYKAPSILPEPTGESTLDEIETKWNSIRTDFEEFLMQFPHDALNKLVFRQPYAGPINILHTLDFLAAHIDHHVPQVESNIAAQRNSK